MNEMTWKKIRMYILQQKNILVGSEIKYTAGQ